MKLRVRSIATKETVRVTTPDTSSLLELKIVIASSFASSSPASIPISPDAIHLSLNQTDELVAANDGDTLSSLGLMSGDLLFYSYSPFPQTLANRNPSVPPNSVPPVSTSVASSSSNNQIGNPDKGTPMYPSQINLSSEPMVLDVSSSVSKESENTHLIPQFLVELMDTGSQEDASIIGRVVMLTHVAMLDTGFSLVNGSGPNLPQGWTSQISSLRLMYTIPDFVNQVQAMDEKVAVLKFSVLGNMVTVYGYMGGVKPEFYRFCFDLVKIATLFSLDLSSLSKSQQDELMKIFCEVKDGVSLPLMVDLCLRNGLPLPPCFMFLSIDMKSKILDLLPGVEAVRLGSTCKEMRNLALDENLWKRKVEREFSSSFNDNTVISTDSWRERYKKACIAKKSALRFRPRESYRLQFGTMAGPRRLGPHNFIVGGDGDRFPAFGAGLEEAGLGNPRRGSRIGGLASPRCNFGGLI